MGAKSSKIHLKNDNENKDSSIKENNTRSSSPNGESGRDWEDPLTQKTTGTVPLKNDNLIDDILRDDEFWLDA